jgi:hypothetical protein
LAISRGTLGQLRSPRPFEMLKSFSASAVIKLQDPRVALAAVDARVALEVRDQERDALRHVRPFTGTADAMYLARFAA